jgi:putative addiction module CopG family antidote
MTATRDMTITLPAEIADLIDTKVASGSYQSRSDVVQDGLRILIERDDALETWLRTDVVAGHAEYLADPSKGVKADEVLDRIKSNRTARRA